MRNRPTLLVVCASLLLGCGPAEPPKRTTPPVEPAADTDVALVLMIVCDALRADVIADHRDRFGAGGFGRLIDGGAWYTSALFPYATTLTAVGHASIYTGGAPADHGIVGNYWFDRQTGALITSVEGPAADSRAEQAAGPTQLLATTIGDELVRSSNGVSRVFSVSVKDRGAILPGGREGKALWFSRDEGVFTTSSYYYPEGPPAWLAAWNAAHSADRYAGRSWELFDARRETYTRASEDDRPEERPYNEPFGRGATFPHSLAGFTGADLYRQLLYTPFGDELTMELAAHVLDAERLGRGPHTDLLAVSFSGADYIGHAWGPASLEYEDNLLHLDALLARLLDAVDETVGLDRTLIVLTADHGVDAIPEYSSRSGQRAGRIDPADIPQVIDSALQHEFDTDEPFTVGFRNPSVYLDLQTVAQLGLDIAEVEAAAAAAVKTIDGVAAALTRTDLMAGNVPDDRLTRMLAIAFHPERSGNVLIYQDEHFFLYHVHDYDSAMHGSPYVYDTHVPLFFAGPGIAARTVDRPVTPLDVAPTIAEMLGISPPSGSRGNPLAEVLGK